MHDAHDIALHIARSGKLQPGPGAGRYLAAKVRKYGRSVVDLAVRYEAVLPGVRAANPDRCQAHIDAEAKKIIRGF